MCLSAITMTYGVTLNHACGNLVAVQSTQILIKCSEISPKTHLIDKIDVTFKHYQIRVTWDQSILQTANNRQK